MCLYSRYIMPKQYLENKDVFILIILRERYYKALTLNFEIGDASYKRGFTV